MPFDDLYELSCPFLKMNDTFTDMVKNEDSSFVPFLHPNFPHH